jgi:excisionase family DNA binding protein
MNGDELQLLASELAERIATATTLKLLDATEAAELLNVPASWVLSEARAGRIPHVRLGKYVRFESTAITNWLAGRAIGPYRKERRAR